MKHIKIPQDVFERLLQQLSISNIVNYIDIGAVLCSTFFVEKNNLSSNGILLQI